MPVEQIDNLRVGQIIRFRSLSNHDNVLWVGQITAFCDYQTAMFFQDITSYYADVARSVSTPLTAKETSRYIVLRVQENGSAPVNRVFGTEWIDVSSLEVIEENTYTDFRVYDINANSAEDIRSALLSMGYTVDILKLN